jgi:hypothetical protein
VLAGRLDRFVGLSHGTGLLNSHSKLTGKFPAFLIDLMIDLNQCIREGFGEETTTTVKDVTGNDTISFEQFVRDNKEAWL